MDNAIILFTRIPLLGKTKTRLQPFLTDRQCCLLHRAFLRDVFHVLGEVSVPCDILVCYTPEGNLAELEDLLPGAAAFFPQQGAALGEKMHNAIRHVLCSGYKRCVLIGSDLPLLRAKAIEEAFAFLESNDIVLCPTEDGGYYLVGMKQPCEEIFNMEYGVSDVFEKTLATAKALGKTCAVGEATMDVDDPQDLLRLAERLNKEGPQVCANIRAVLGSFTVMEDRHGKL